MSKETRLVARLKAMTGLTALTSTRIYPLIVPQGQTLPAVVYQLLSCNPVNDSTSTSGTRAYSFRVMPMAEASDSAAGYYAMVAVADAIIGDESRTSPTGLSGWTDADGDIWHLDSMSDVLGEIESGQDVLRVYAREMIFSVWL
jgi:hypothetical protein